ncbi:MAG: prolyl oligopeptidase family serine peptidase [Bacteroidales bacterium]
MNKAVFISRSRVISAAGLFLALYLCSCAQNLPEKAERDTFVYSEEELEQMMEKPVCMGVYEPSQAGSLRKPDGNGGFTFDSTFTVEKISIRSEGYLITGWLYLPPGDKKCPLVILTNGGGNIVRAIRSFSDFMAPILAHCGYAAFVHDKRGTGESEGDYVKTTYDDYITDAGNCAVYLSKHKRIDPEKIGAMGASEGGRVAVIAASRFPVFSFVISQAGTVVSTIDDRMNAQINGMIDQGVMSDSVANLVSPVWRRSFEAWASNDPGHHAKVDEEIGRLRDIYDRSILPFTKSEMDSIPDFEIILPTWNSLGADYMTEMEHFTKKWLAIFGAKDRVVPTDESVRNINRYMSTSGNRQCNIAVIPRMGHVPVDIETKRRINFDYLIINWLNQNVKE